MARSDITIGVDRDVIEIFKATRVIFCKAYECKFNTINLHRGSGEMNCSLKNVSIGVLGICEYFTQKEDAPKNA